MTRFTVFLLRLGACVLVMVGAIVACALRLWSGMPPADVLKGLGVGIILAWVVGPDHAEMRAIVGVLTDRD
jgi:hypothetical protein